MLPGFLSQRVFSDTDLPEGFPKNLRADHMLRSPVIGIFYVLQIKAPSQHRHIGIGKHGKKPFLHHTVKGSFFIEQKHPVPVEIPQIIRQLTLPGQTAVAVQRRHKFIIRIGVIKLCFPSPAVPENALQTPAAEGSDPVLLPVILDPRKIGTQMILPAACKVFHPVFIFNGDNDPAPFSQMCLQDSQKVFIGRVSANVSLSIFKYADQTNIIKVRGQPRLNICKIAHMNHHIFTFPVTIRVNQTALF